MRLPRFRIRTLMLAVATVGLEFWMLKEYLLAGLLLGPLLGATLAAFRPRYRQDDFDRPVGLVCGAIAGGVVGSVMVTLGVIGYPGGGFPAPVPTWALFCLLLMASVLVGILVGIALGVLDILRASIFGPGTGAGCRCSDPPVAIESALAGHCHNNGADPYTGVGVGMRLDDATTGVSDRDR